MSATADRAIAAVLAEIDSWDLRALGPTHLQPNWERFARYVVDAVMDALDPADLGRRWTREQLTACLLGAEKTGTVRSILSLFPVDCTDACMDDVCDCSGIWRRSGCWAMNDDTGGTGT